MTQQNAATAEELASQTEQLQHTIAFFQVCAGGQIEQVPPLQRISVEEAGTNGCTQRNPDSFEFEGRKALGDEQDEVFERY